MQEVAAVYSVERFDTIKGPAKVPFSFAESKYNKLLSWIDTLSQEMAYGQQCPPHVIIFQ